MLLLSCWVVVAYRICLPSKVRAGSGTRDWQSIFEETLRSTRSVRQVAPTELHTIYIYIYIYLYIYIYIHIIYIYIYIYIASERLNRVGFRPHIRPPICLLCPVITFSCFIQQISYIFEGLLKIIAYFCWMKYF